MRAWAALLLCAGCAGGGSGSAAGAAGDGAAEAQDVRDDGASGHAGQDAGKAGEAGSPDAADATTTPLDAGADATDAGMDAAVGPPCQVGTQTGTCLPTAACSGQSTPGFCKGPADIQCCTQGWTCDPQAHPQPNAGLGEGPGSPGCPAGMQKVEKVCVDRYEASLVEVLPGGMTQPWSPYWNPGTKPVRAVSLAGAVPQGYVSGQQAQAACQAAGKRLCTDAEWLRACQGPGKTTYPYGKSLQPGVCNDHRALHPAVELYGTTAAWIYGKIQNACLNQLPHSLDRTGQRGGCVSAEGLYDLMGNVHEWTADAKGTFRGGYYVDTKLNGPGCLYVTTAHDMGHWDYSTGFRCCADPLP